MDPINYTRCHIQHHVETSKPWISAIMFALGLFGNVAALVILEVRRRRAMRTANMWRRSLFHVLITALVVTDLAGTCLISPLVQLSYSLNRTLVGMTHPSHSVCSYFGISMTFFSLATMTLLFSMALERCFAIGYPYLYSRHVTKKCAYISIPVVFLLCMLFCLLPFAGFGKYVQYCPGTWCFIDMNPIGKEDRVYANLYATLMLVLVLAIVACNGFVVYQLYRMYRRRRRNGGSVMAAVKPGERRATSMAEEVEHLILLVFMTIIFFICTMPLVIRVYINSLRPTNESHGEDLKALRFISINSIIDPWVFILLSPSVLHFFWASVCRAPLETFRGSILRSSIAKENCHTNFELSRPTLEYTEHFHSVETL
ncbi:prostaglandin E receptor 2a (subtype EP2) [Anarrhichthys ocellatus]|uniref:prostaglandin E receptor 2a (subtype EP2) n=1 Tax=Anarrhichthys ocellatus TaxID=433405 RepID=UPI0012EE4A64|nr:prostaglandin E2 receptor EP2 subtype [Anarrhichthys ocellatus]XP_031708283.1 prostaglandin E2 receptor EP2 subtype [Anarrhichthys ocellatus]XP_031708284.1 prostaglandin E2 receptor EP2 subtype [Anarrhichthys ocellatus]XP_031708285.1 prostaglandin E2 receptor EP2 subtype [Anarrhichthys ocellatus]XP_031708286.1 prostaglandin E2 receptor EP2 subtype [Anarrhichthys ocellatus]XP_031708287.1 prostaglandin E2 receptor EP2 subtype [Anarrhichthys ocellatus]XP_031708288.1 prostaglandin E2 receptor 